MSEVKFSELGLLPEMQRAIDELGFETATDIQAEAIPAVREGRDVIGKSQTGTGKTLAFAIPAIEKMNREKAAKLYAAIDNSDGFFYGTVDPSSRSTMNVTFRIKGQNEELEKKFVAEAKANGMVGLKGHRAVGGLRASIYNAMPAEGVQTLIDFMKEFARVNG